MAKVLVKRGTRSQINAAGAANGLNQGEIYLVTDEDRLAVGKDSSTAITLANLSDAGSQGEPGTTPLTWDYFAANWTAAPSQAGIVAAGNVYAYTLGGVTRYRLVPSVYSAAQDAFYSSFSGGVLSGLIISRG